MYPQLENNPLGSLSILSVLLSEIAVWLIYITSNMSWGTEALSYIKRSNIPTADRQADMNTFPECGTVRLSVQPFVLFRFFSLSHNLYPHWSNFKVSPARLSPSLTHQKILNMNWMDCFIAPLLVQQSLWKCSAHNLWRPCVINHHPQIVWITLS